ncbi:hypothetical protein Rhe02_19010 [Rhizocola hellebori]|uniref:Uncharacterized protein n=1 Tax=Rhizocola hellebori TaxID=1392758 RepID=A0A8J3VDT4_9ACTN|nr:hypothetical protein [Rhizocola hellebori]GIH03834.1 hypothetical protein Rhe02_19010 [Rhizocola hellebori]
MWHINSLTTPTGEKGAIWGGNPNAVGPRAFGERLGPQGSAYVVSAGDLGSLTIRDIGAGPGPGQWALLINDKQQCLYMGEGQLAITVDAGNVAQITGGVAPVAIPLLREMEDTGSITRQIISLVSSAPSLYPAWNADPMTLMYAAGFPRSAMLNLRQQIGNAPDCCAQFMTWLKTVHFPTGAEAEAMGGWLSCALCKGFVVGCAAAAFVAVAAACIAAGPAGAAGAVAVLETSSSVAALATAGGLTVSAVARMAVTVFFAAGAAAFVGSLIDSLCASIGACDNSALAVDLSAAAA